jgi:hypothetical protein
MVKTDSQSGSDQLSLDLLLGERIAQLGEEQKIEQECRAFLFGENGITRPAFTMEMTVGQLSAFWYEGIEKADEWEKRYAALAEPIVKQINQLSDELRKIKGSAPGAREARRPIRAQLQSLRDERDKLSRYGSFGYEIQAQDFEALQEKFEESLWSQWETRKPKPSEDKLEAACEDLNDTVYNEKAFDLTWYWTLQDAADVAITATTSEEPERNPQFCEAYLRARRRDKDGALSDTIELTRGEMYFGSGFVRRLARHAGIRISNDNQRTAHAQAQDSHADAKAA